MKAIVLVMAFLVLISTQAHASSHPRGEYVQADNLYPKVKMVTSLGTIIFELNRSKAPITVNNFLSYVDAKRYDNTLFHRLEHTFVLQGGGYSDKFESVDEYPEIVNESGNGLKNEVGTISMARQYAPHSATSQFFINLGDNKSLDPGRNWGYAVFGYIVEGEEVLEKLNEIDTHVSPDLGWRNYPKTPIVIKSLEIMAEEE